MADRLDFALKNPKLRRWCVYEWFYPTIDRGFFNQNEFQEALNDNHLSKIPRMSRIEWCYFRESLGKPRRFSEAFLREEREQLGQHRDSVRNQRNGVGAKNYSKDLPPHLNEGTNVVIHHQGELYRGTVVSVVHPSSYSVLVPSLGSAPLSVPDDCVMSCEVEPRFLSASPDYYSSSLQSEEGFQTPTKVEASGADSNSNVNNVIGGRVIRSEHLVEYMKLLRIKHEILKEITIFNRDAEDMALAGEEYPKEFKKNYAYCISLLNATNKELEVVQNRFVKTSTPDTMTRSLAELPSDKFQPWLRQISPKCKNTARKLVSDRLTKINLKSSEDSIQEDSLAYLENTQDHITKSVSSCVSLLLHLAECAEAELPTVDMNFAVESALASCRPRFDANTNAFLDLEKEVREIQSEFLSRPPKIK
eukprot:TRINITY_DN6088_c0_g1_i2.p1 TRINITY_DN6088_c0_g1~~TRINITY_DN6088_c0_g1_i2.p1  ORF type:complete len:420 (+),score=144.84 TRINITY_DN6088_c0_g1_i2:461-1720(+)